MSAPHQENIKRIQRDIIEALDEDLRRTNSSSLWEEFLLFSLGAGFTITLLVGGVLLLG